MPKIKLDDIAPTLKRMPRSAPPSPKLWIRFEADAEWFREAKPLKEVLPELWEQWYGNGQQSDNTSPNSDNGIVERG